LHAARELAEGASDDAMTADLLLEEATALDWAHSFVESARRAEHARVLIERLPGGRLTSRLHMTLGRSLFRQQRVAEAIDHLHRAAEGAQAEGDHDTRVVALLMLSSALVLLGRLEEAEAKFHEVIALCGEVEDRLHLGSAYANRSLLWTARDAPDRALEDLRRAIQIAREVGNPWMERNATHNVAELLYWSGHDDEALALAERSRILEERFVERVVPDDSLLLARIQASRGDDIEARRLLAWVSERCPIATLAPTERVFLQALSLILADASLPTDAAAWDRLVDEAVQGFPAEELLEVLYWRARAAIRNGRWDEAVQCVNQSSHRLEACPIWRPRFEELMVRLDSVLARACSNCLLEQAANARTSDIV
jgi:tetratricopeptide (TPR) repeat protein